MARAVRVTIRYDTKNDEGKTRRERNEEFGIEIKAEVNIPFAGMHLWEWFWSLSARRLSGLNGAEPLTSTEIFLWSKLTGNIISPEDFKILCAMDAAWRETMATEIKANSEEGADKPI